MQEDVKGILFTIEKYFHGIYTGNTTLLREVFHPTARLYGEIDGLPYLKSLEEYLQSVELRQSPQELKEEFKMKMISLERIQNIAYVKTRVPVFQYDYHDILSLKRMGDQWIIVNKLFIHFIPD